MPKIVDHESKRAEISAAAWRVIADRGVEAATVREIAAAADCSTGVLAHYFTDKDQLLLHALRLAWQQGADRMQRHAESTAGLAALRLVLLEGLPLDAERRREWRIWISFWGRAVGNPALRDEQRQRHAAWRGLIGRLLRQASQRGELHSDLDPELAADELAGLIDGIGLEATLAPENFAPGRLEAVVNAALARLRGGPDSN